jgi:hypothetical protein
MEWKKEHESILANWCDTAQCYRWLCFSSHEKYSKLQYMFSIPTIIMSTVIGAASFTTIATSTKFGAYMPLIIGSVNITIGIFNTLQQYFKISEYNEHYRICGLAWAKLERTIEFELSKSREERGPASPFIRKASEDLERLMETTPLFPKEIICILAIKLESDQFRNVRTPSVLTEFHPSINYISSWHLKNDSEINSIL